MTISTDQPARSIRFREAIAAFIDERREAKLKGAEDAKTAAKYEYTTWLADAVRRVAQIQAVTHVLKATHPDARGSNLHVAPDTLPAHPEIGTHVLGDTYAEDVVGNAAALDVFKFLKTEVDGRRLLDWMRAGDDDLRDVLHENADTAAEWMQAFARLVRGDTQPSAHSMAKQIYWCVGDDPCEDRQYHLLQPLFSSSLEHVIHQEIKNALWEEPNKSARKAKWQKNPSDTLFRDYRNVVGRKLGGSNKQNVSQLNSERGGLNYLLDSIPPRWASRKPIKLRGIDSAMERLTFFPGVRGHIRSLSKLLLGDPKNVMETRQAREAIEQSLGASLAAFGAEVRHRFTPGWTREPDYQVPLCEQLWLDPDRCELPSRKDHFDEDEAFKAAYTFGDWPNEVAGRFANWINAQLRKAGIVTVSDAEFRHWAKQAVIDAAWPIPIQRHAPQEAQT